MKEVTYTKLIKMMASERPEALEYFICLSTIDSTQKLLRLLQGSKALSFRVSNGTDMTLLDFLLRHKGKREAPCYTNIIVKSDLTKEKMSEVINLFNKYCISFLSLNCWLNKETSSEVLQQIPYKAMVILGKDVSALQIKLLTQNNIFRYYVSGDTPPGIYTHMHARPQVIFGEQSKKEQVEALYASKGETLRHVGISGSTPSEVVAAIAVKNLCVVLYASVNQSQVDCLVEHNIKSFGIKRPFVNALKNLKGEGVRIDLISGASSAVVAQLIKNDINRFTVYNETSVETLELLESFSFFYIMDDIPREELLPAIPMGTLVYLEAALSADQMGKIKAHHFMVGGNTPDSALQAIPATAKVFLGPNVRADQIRKINASRLGVHGNTPDAVLQAIPATAIVVLEPCVCANQIGKIKAHHFMVGSKTPDATLQAVPATATVYLGSCVHADQIRKINASRLGVYGYTPDAVLQAIPATATVYLGSCVPADQVELIKSRFLLNRNSLPITFATNKHDISVQKQSSPKRIKITHNTDHAKLTVNIGSHFGQMPEERTEQEVDCATSLLSINKRG